MTEFRLPPLVVDFNQLWLRADVHGDGADWPERAAAELLSRQQWAAYRTADGERRLTALMRQAAVIARTQAGDSATMGFILIPSPEEGVKGMAAFSPVDLAGRDAAEAWDDLLEQLAPELPGDYPPDVTPVQTKAGECRRLRMRYAAGAGPERPAGEHIAYLWVFGDYGAAVVMTISFADLLEAARWLPALDELAAGVWLQRYPGEGESKDGPGHATPGGLVEVRPARPAGKLLPAEGWTLDHWRLTADAGNGTLTLTGDRYRSGRARVFPLAAAGRSDGVTTVCLATYRWQVRPGPRSIWRMLLLDREGALVGAGLGRAQTQALRLFPPEVFEPLTAAGIRVVSESYDSAQALEDAHSGAAGKVALTGANRGRMAAIGLTAALLILIVVGVAVYFTR